MFNLDDCIALITSRSAKIFVASLEKRLRPYNITRIQWFALYYIHGNESLTQRELADLLAVKEPAVVRLIHDLEHQELLTRSGNSSDKRVRHLFLTAKGEQLCVQVMPVVEQFKSDTVEGISLEHLEILKNCLAKMVENAKRPLR